MTDDKKLVLTDIEDVKPEKKGANVTMPVETYKVLAKTADVFRWTVPQYLGFVGEYLASRTEAQRRKMVILGLEIAEETGTTEEPLVP